MDDARIRELEFLMRIERKGSVSANILDEDGAVLRDPRVKEMIVHLLSEGYLNGVEHAAGREDWELMRRSAEVQYWDDIGQVLRKQQVTLRLSHKGRVRISELRDALTTGKYRDPSGLLWSKRHYERDFTVAVLGAGAGSPLSLAVLDMNGLKKVNDEHGHDAGDQVIKTYLQAVAVFTGDRVDGYRGDGGDEVYLVLRATDGAAARKLIDSLIIKLGTERVALAGGHEVKGVKACCGLVTTTDPRAVPPALTESADKRLYRAKAQSKRTKSRDSIVVDSDS
jgi:diguanylate cyclase (GGDEF)-like protein